jgi:hypothetical protein
MDFGFGGNGETMYSLPDLARHVADAYQDLRTAARPAGRSRGRPKRAVAGGRVAARRGKGNQHARTRR